MTNLGLVSAVPKAGCSRTDASARETEGVGEGRSETNTVFVVAWM